MLEPWIETHSGKRMYFLEPTIDMIDIKDIAHSLSLQCRFSGHTSKFYSVAEHSIRVAQHLAHRNQSASIILQGLLHDASEAYLLDVPSPVKQCLTNYKDIESRLMKCIMEALGSSWPLGAAVKEMDSIILKNEARQLLPSKGASWVDHYPTAFESYEKVWCASPEEAEGTFLLWYEYLLKDVNARELEHDIGVV